MPAGRRSAPAARRGGGVCTTGMADAVRLGCGRGARAPCSSPAGLRVPGPVRVAGPSHLARGKDPANGAPVVALVLVVQVAGIRRQRRQVRALQRGGWAGWVGGWVKVTACGRTGVGWHQLALQGGWEGAGPDREPRQSCLAGCNQTLKPMLRWRCLPPSITSNRKP